MTTFLKTDILKVLEAKDYWTSTRDIAGIIGSKADVTRRALKALEKAGKVESRWQKRYDPQNARDNLFGGCGAMIRRFLVWQLTNEEGN